MIIYSVTVLIDAAIEPQWLEWMRRVHIPDVLATGCFTGCDIYRLLDAPTAEHGYVMHYRCRAIQDYERYRDGFAAALQKDHTERFAGRFRASRQLLEQVENVAAP